MANTFKAVSEQDSVYGEHSVKVYYEDTDHSGSVYHPNYLKFLDRAREHLLGLKLLKDLALDGLQFVVYDAHLRYLKPAKHGDTLVIKTIVHYSQSPKLHCEHSVIKLHHDGEQILAQGHIDLVMVNNQHRPTLLPQLVRERFEQLTKANRYEKNVVRQ